MTNLFELNVSTIIYHLKNLYNTTELQNNRGIRIFRIPRLKSKCKKKNGMSLSTTQATTYYAKPNYQMDLVIPTCNSSWVVWVFIKIKGQL